MLPVQSEKECICGCKQLLKLTSVERKRFYRFSCHIDRKKGEGTYQKRRQFRAEKRAYAKPFKNKIDK